jgi:opacity protein-like surface antigen
MPVFFIKLNVSKEIIEYYNILEYSHRYKPKGRKMKLLYVLPILSVLPITSFAQNLKGYVGFNLNYDRAQLNDEIGEEFSYETGFNVDTNDLINPNNYGFSLNAGAQINKYFGVEGFFQYTFNSSAEIDFYDIYNTKVSNYKAEASSLAFGLDAIGYLPIDNTKFSFMGTVGVGYYKFDGTFKVINYVYDIRDKSSSDESNVAFRIGIGGQYDISNQWAIRGMVRYVALNSDEEPEPLVEMARISVDEGVKGSIFPFNAWEVNIWSNDHDPPRFHIKRNGWNVSFSIETGEQIELISQGAEKNVYDYMIANVPKWLDRPSAILPQITNRQNAMTQWLQLHG